MPSIGQYRQLLEKRISTAREFQMSRFFFSSRFVKLHITIKRTLVFLTSHSTRNSLALMTRKAALCLSTEHVLLRKENNVESQPFSSTLLLAIHDCKNDLWTPPSFFLACAVSILRLLRFTHFPEKTSEHALYSPAPTGSSRSFGVTCRPVVDSSIHLVYTTNKLSISLNNAEVSGHILHVYRASHSMFHRTIGIADHSNQTFRSVCGLISCSSTSIERYSTYI